MSEMKEVKRYTRIGLDGAGLIAEFKMVDASAYDALRAQLPEGMEHCTIRLGTCAKCERSWLQPTNWVNRGCPHCERDALLSENAALVAENERLAANYQIAHEAAGLAGDSIRERDRRRDEVRHLRSAIAGTREAIEDGYIHLEQDADDAENSSMLTRLRQKTVAKWRASAEQLRALSSIGDLPVGEEG